MSVLKIRDANGNVIEIPTLTSGIGQPIDGGGEIFNDYENNKAICAHTHSEGYKTLAGSKYFKILDANETTRTFELDGDVSELAVDDVFSCQVGNCYDLYGKITAIEVESNIIQVDNFPPLDRWDVGDNFFRVPDKPFVGTQIGGFAAHVEGSGNKALGDTSHAEGFNNVSEGHHSHTEGRNTLATYCAHAEGEDSKAIGFCSHAEGSSNKVYGWAGHGEGARLPG